MKPRQVYIVEPDEEDMAEIEAGILRADLPFLLVAAERKRWRWTDLVDPPTYYRLTPHLLDLLRRQIATVVHRDHGGYYDARSCIVRSDGTGFWTEMTTKKTHPCVG